TVESHSTASMSSSNISASEIDAINEMLATFVTICSYLMINLGLTDHTLSTIVFTSRVSVLLP
ncbi:unnamed protein product, partial [Rotaria magnacalcarata]